MNPLQSTELFLEKAAGNNPKHSSTLEFVLVVDVEQPQGQGLCRVEREVGDGVPDQHRRFLFRFFLRSFLAPFEQGFTGHARTAMLRLLANVRYTFAKQQL